MSASSHTIHEARAALTQVFGYANFRGGQEHAVVAILQGQDTVVLLPTGAGKSLCYQIPAIVFARANQGTTLVVSPLIALMNDQVKALAARGVRAAALHSHSEDEASAESVRAFLRGELAMLYVSPERAASDSFRRLLSRTRIALIAIDEAHCVSHWGHDFRPEYMRLTELRTFAAAPIIAVTATATPTVLTDLVRGLALVDPHIVRGDFARPNLAFSVSHLKGDDERVQALITRLDEDGFRGRNHSGRCIVYCATRKTVERLAEELEKTGFSAGYYHAGRTPLQRERAERAFAQSKTKILVATNAFGMGVDYPDVRLVVHAQCPASLEAYYQEAGRASRDGGPGACWMMFGIRDLMTHRRMHELDSASEAMRQRQAHALAEVERYANASACRQAVLVAHFTAANSAHSCGVCDNCIAPDAAHEHASARPAPVELGPSPLHVREQILASVATLAKPVGKGNLAKALRGSRAKGVLINGLDRMHGFGALESESEEMIAHAVEELVQSRKLARFGKKYPTVGLPNTRPRLARSTTTGAKTSGSRSIARDLDLYRKRMARSLKWKTYMVLQRGVILAIEKQKPTSTADLMRISGLGPMKIARFGEDILEVVRKHTR